MAKKQDTHLYLKYGALMSRSSRRRFSVGKHYHLLWEGPALQNGGIVCHRVQTRGVYIRKPTIHYIRNPTSRVLTKHLMQSQNHQSPEPNQVSGSGGVEVHYQLV